MKRDLFDGLCELAEALLFWVAFGLVSAAILVMAVSGCLIWWFCR